METLLEPSEKEGKIINLRSNTYQRLKFGENRSSRFWDHFARMLIFKKKLTITEQQPAGHACRAR